mmetsp:Transcript_51227/g.135343  ORF Transcript_51227/g.135343 Transcript_51227/m.135343 type:complete len:342 (+) Transcript_51227:535-1560(+)
MSLFAAPVEVPCGPGAPGQRRPDAVDGGDEVHAGRRGQARQGGLLRRAPRGRADLVQVVHDEAERPRRGLGSPGRAQGGRQALHGVASAPLPGLAGARPARVRVELVENVAEALREREVRVEAVDADDGGAPRQQRLVGEGLEEPALGAHALHEQREAELQDPQPALPAMLCRPRRGLLLLLRRLCHDAGHPRTQPAREDRGGEVVLGEAHRGEEVQDRLVVGFLVIAADAPVRVPPLRLLLVVRPSPLLRGRRARLVDRALAGDLGRPRRLDDRDAVQVAPGLLPQLSALGDPRRGTLALAPRRDQDLLGGLLLGELFPEDAPGLRRGSLRRPLSGADGR